MGLCRLHSISRQLIELSRDVSVRLVSAVVMSRLDYCNAVLAGLPAATRTQSQRVLNAAARLALDLKPRDRATSASCTGYPFHNRSTTSCVHIHRSVSRLHLRPAHTGRQHAQCCAPPATTTSFCLHRPCGDLETMLQPVRAISYRQNWNSCGRQ